MKKLSIFLVAAVVGAVLLGCNSQEQNAGRARPSPQATQSANAQHDHAAETAVPRIGVMDTQAAVNRGEAVLLDVRQPAAFSSGRIKGAILMPEAEIPSRAGTLPKDKKIITYCA